MSLVAFAIRIAAVRAIQAGIWPEFAVLDSPQTPLDLIAAGKPLIAVYTGHDTDRMEGRDLLGGQPKVVLTLQIFLPAQFAINVAGQVLKLDTTAEAAETVLDVVARRIDCAFLGQAEPWSRLLFDLVQRTGRSTNASYLIEADKIRTAAREMTIECDVIQEPIPGASASDVWAALVALMRIDTSPRSVAPLADWIAAEIAGPAALGQADRDRMALGLSTYAAQRVQIAPAVEDVDDVAGVTSAIDEISADPAADVPDGYVIAS